MALQGNEVFNIDGLSLRVFVTELRRTFQVLDSEVSGRLQSVRMFRDIEGTFYNYKMSVEPDPKYRDDYNTFYEIISAPVESHTLIFPYGDTMMEFEAYVTSGEDSFRNRKPGGKSVNLWSGLSIDFTAMEPQRRP